MAQEQELRACFECVQRYRMCKKTEKFPKQINKEYFRQLDFHQSSDIRAGNALAAEMDKMWSYYHDKKHQIWLWREVDHATNTPIVYSFGTREHKYLDELLALLKPFNTGTVYADDNHTYLIEFLPKIS